MDDILSALEMTSSSDFVKVSQALSELEHELLLFRADDNQYLTQKQAGVVTGRISINRSGLGFVDREDRESIKIDPTDQNTALDGDTVLVRCKPWETYGEVLRVISRAKDFMIGTFLPRGKRLKFIPDDEKLQDKLITVKYDQDFLPLEGMKVLCRIQKYGTAIVVYVERVIGYKDDPGVDILAILLDHDIDPQFPEAVMEEVKTIPQEIQESDKKDRIDLTNETIVTIDGDDSKDFDDAVSVTPVENGWVLKVSIADVSHYVTENSALDKEALERGCSTYVTDRVVPMLPHELSNGICSLNPYVERLTITCQMNVSHSGKIEEYSIYPSVIRSTERMTYANVNRILDGDEKLQEEYKHLGNLFFALRDCADAIRASRTAKGAIDFDGTESVVEVDENGHPIDVHARITGHAERIIEDCMIAANVSVANYMKWLDVPSI
ncbi:MAG: VacB/RNase II family 3'-5' exoribonuclease, partial [Solobacterium sp.]|nr:VacB/RNase II family 3'-5' exoribonuclease [Solobacterium sp.]